MIFELDSIDEIKNSFISTEEVEKELKNNPFGKYLIMKNNNEIIGYIYYSDIYERAEINQFEIKSIHRNCGKGDILLRSLINRLKKDITLEVKKDNIPAIKLYKKNGFQEKAIRQGYYNGIDGILMEREYKEETKK